MKRFSNDGVNSESNSILLLRKTPVPCDVTGSEEYASFHLIVDNDNELLYQGKRLAPIHEDILGRYGIEV